MIPKPILKHFINKLHKSSLCHWRVTTKQKLGWKVHTFFWIGSLSHCCLTANQRDQPHIVTTTKKPIRKEKMQLIQSGHHKDKYHASDDVVILCPRGETPLDFFFLLFVCHFVTLVHFLSLARWIVRLHSHSSRIAVHLLGEIEFVCLIIAKVQMEANYARKQILVRLKRNKRLW